MPLLNLAFQPLLRCVLEYCVFSTNYTRQLWQAFVAGNLEAAGFDATSSVSLAYVMKEVDALKASNGDLEKDLKAKEEALREGESKLTADQAALEEQQKALTAAVESARQTVADSQVASAQLDAEIVSKRESA